MKYEQWKMTFIMNRRQSRLFNQICDVEAVTDDDGV